MLGMNRDHQTHNNIHNIHREPTVEREWKEFENPSPKSTNGLYVSLSPRGVLVLNRLAYANLGNPAAVKLLYDHPHGTIGVEATPPFLPTSCAVKPRGVSGNQVVWALPFLEKNAITPRYTVKFLDPYFENAVLLRDLHFTARSTQSPRTEWRKKRR